MASVATLALTWRYQHVKAKAKKLGIKLGSSGPRLTNSLQEQNGQTYTEAAFF